MDHFLEPKKAFYKKLYKELKQLNCINNMLELKKLFIRKLI